MTLRDAITVLARLWWLLPWVRTRWTPVPWARCHCGDLADFRDIVGQDWCSPCKFAWHDTCECSQEVSDGR